MRQSYYFYIVRCSDRSLYSGVTTDIARRVGEHNESNAKGAKYTRSHRPVELVYVEQYSSKSEAMKREYEVKKWQVCGFDTLVI